MASYVYFWQGESDVWQIYTPIKIGKANDVDERLRTFQTARPDKVVELGRIKCRNSKAAFDLETSLHHQFAHLRIDPDHEWFEFGPEIMRYLLSKGIKPKNLFAGAKLYLRAIVEYGKAIHDLLRTA